MLTIKQWQIPTQHTVVTKYTEINTLPCFKCNKVSNEAITGVHHNVYSSNKQTFCIDCWDQESWECPHCDQTPGDKDCVSCWKCGQWAHRNCKVVHIDDVDDYVCNQCKYAGELIDVLSFQKKACDTKLKVVANDLKVANDLNEKTISDKSNHLKHKIQHADEIKKIKAEATAATIKIQAESDKLLKQNALIYKKKIQDINLWNQTNTKKMAKNMRNMKQKISAISTTNNELSTQIASMETSIQARSETVSHMKTMTVEKNNALKALKASNARNISVKRQLLSLKNVNKELEKQITQLQNDERKNNKRGRDCEQMMEHMHRLVKKYRARWHYHPPTKLPQVEQMLWDTYKCKTDGSSFSADKLLCQGIPPSWDSLQKTLDAIKTYHIQSLMQPKHPEKEQ